MVWTCGCPQAPGGAVWRHDPGCPEKAEYDRRTAEMSSYWACCCGLDHVAGCKVQRGTRIVQAVAVFALSMGALSWWWR